MTFHSFPWLSEQKLWRSLQNKAENGQDNSNQVLILTYGNFILSSIDYLKNFTYRSKMYLISFSQTSSESVGVIEEFLILAFFPVFTIVKV